METDPDTLGTVERAFEILEILWRLDGAGPTELAERLGVPKGTVHGYLRTLTATGYAVSESGTYRVSHKFLAMGGRLKYRNRLFHVARPELERLADETGELVGLDIEEAGQSVVLHHERGEQALSLGLYPGMHTPMHVHAAGKVGLAFFPPERTEAIIADGLEASTEHTITDPAELREELERIREQGYAVDWDQHVKGMGMVAAPVIVVGRVLGSIAILCPTDRLKNESYREELVQNVLEASNTVEVSYQFSK